MPVNQRELPDEVQLVVVGAGFSGVGAAIRLKQQGIEDFCVLEKADDLGGTWRDNSYPGAACDIPSQLYSFSFALNPDWSRSFSPQEEIWQYLWRCVDRFSVGDHLYFGQEVLEASWDETAARWRIQTKKGELLAKVLVWATGLLSEPVVPDLPGLDGFSGPIFHSAAWDHGVDLTGKTVAVVGTGASAIQIVPELQKSVGRLFVFQRSAPWVVPRRDRAVPLAERRLFRFAPPLQRLARGWMYWTREMLVPAFMHPASRWRQRGMAMARQHLERQVPDPDLRAALTPTYQLGCKRVLISDEYYPALCADNVELVTEAVARLGEHSVTDAKGVERPVDAVVLATGFNASAPSFSRRIVGREGRRLSEVWADNGMEAYLGCTVAGFPNMFFVVGPNTGLGHNSMIFIIESQLNYLLDFLRYADSHGIETAEVRRKVESRYNREIQSRLAGSVWNTGGCASWYLDRRGHNTTLWPGSSYTFRRRTRRFRPADYVLQTTRKAPVAV
ncbi:MAG TPA: NAD(P)/FAD-dependent oxidoreductase [Acidimicrobiales bacterium]|nr:NAD(P)/FAD-dependent oxidoreductase [Acidimicrobiales bacterium]